MRDRVTEKRDWIEEFKWFHQHPELGFQEYGTTKKIKEILEEEKIEILESDLDTGLIAVINGEKEGKSIGYRADMDALPIAEKTNLDYSSANPNVMHACGHDFHITVALAAASRLNKRKSEIYGKIYFIFQPGEEVVDGAKKVIQTGLLKEVTEYYALHVSPALPTGTYGIKEGAVMAAVDQFKVLVKGRGAHGATPHVGNSPIPPIIQMVSDLQHIIPDKISALHPCVLSITQINAGTTWNVIPEEGYFQGTVRTTESNDRELIRNQFVKKVQSIADMYEVETEIQWHAGPSSVINSKELVNRLEPVFEKSKVESQQIETAMTSDDFSAYVEENNAKGLYIRAGVGIGHPLHHPKFQVDVAAIPQSINFVENMLLNVLSSTADL